MRSGLRRVVTAALWLGLFADVAAGIAVAAPGETAKEQAKVGAPTVTRAGKTSDIDAVTLFQEGDVVRVPEAGLLTIEFADQSKVTMVGPATMNLVEMNEKGRRVLLVSGVVTEAVARGVALEIQSPDPKTSLVLQNARGFARVEPGDKIVFQKLGGTYGKVWNGGKDSDLGDSLWVLNTRTGVAVEEAPPAPVRQAGRPPRVKQPFVEKRMDGNRGVITDGVRPIVFYPATAFDRRRTDGGGFRLTYYGDEGTWGVVEIGRETTLFLAPGDSIDFDGDGNVTRYNGIAHEYRPLFDPIYHANPVQDATDASPSFSRHH
jgi:hypothetical protein